MSVHDHAAVKDLLNNDHKLHHLASSESSIDCRWVRVIFYDEIYM